METMKPGKEYDVRVGFFFADAKVVVNHIRHEHSFIIEIPFTGDTQEDIDETFPNVFDDDFLRFMSEKDNE